MKSIADFKYTPRADSATHITDFLEVVAYIQQIENEIKELRQLQKGHEFVHKVLDSTSPAKAEEGEK
jgi:hypothetical protein